MTNFVALDLETATSVRSSICQIGITEVIDGKVQPSRSWLVKPKGNIYDSYNISIHRITPEDTKNSPSFPEVWKEVKPFLEGKTVVAHNTSFDMYALREAFDEYSIDYPSFDYFCTLRIAKYIVKGCYSYSLPIVLDYLGIGFKGHHKADNDSLGCAKLLLKCLELDGSTLEELEKKHHFHRGKFAHNTFIAHLATGNTTKKELLEGLVEHPELIDEGNYFYGKSVCFTGTCQYGVERKCSRR